MDLIGKRLYYFLFSLAVLVAGLVSQLVSPDLRLGIEFSSGAVVNVSFDKPVTEDDLRNTFIAMGEEDAVVQRTPDGLFFVRIRTSNTLETERENVLTAVTNAYGTPKTFEFTAVSPGVAREAFVAGGIAVALSIVGIMLYMWWAFRKIPQPFRYSVAAIVGLAHNILITLAVSAIIAKFIPMEISSLYLVALLTILGYSINDTIVIFDRMRENILKGVLRDFPSQVNFSLLETFTRSLNTGFSVVLVLLALLFLGPDTTRGFIIALTVGIVAGTYSSIFIAAQLLVTWETRSWMGSRAKVKAAPSSPATPAARPS